MQLDSYERVKDKVSSTSAPFSLARQRLQRANSGINGPPAADSTPEASSTSNQPDADTKSLSQTPPRPGSTPFQTPPRPAPTSSQAPPRSATSTPPRSATSTPERVRAHRMLVPSPAVDLTPPKQASTSTTTTAPSTNPSRGPPARHTPVRAPASPPLNHPAILNSTDGSSSSSSRPASEAEKRQGAGAGAGSAGELGHGGPLTPERMPSGRMPTARIPPGLPADHEQPGRNLKPIQTTRGESLPCFFTLLLLGIEASIVTLLVQTFLH